MGNKNLRGYCWLLSNIFILLFCCIALVHGEIISKPGTFDHLKIDAPDTVISGNEYKINIYACDVFGNPTTVPLDSNKEYRLEIKGLAVVFPSKFRANEIPQSGFPLKFKAEKAGEVILKIYEINSLFPIIERKIKILPAEISELKIRVPNFVQVGSDFEILISGNDRFGNIVCQEFNLNDLNIVFKGDISIRIKEAQYLSDKCKLNIKFFSDKVGFFYIEANLLDKKIKGQSEKVEILNGPVNSFIINTPKEALVNDDFDVTIYAIDKFNNLVKDFAAQKKKILIEIKGKGQIFPSEITSYAFTNGQTKVSFRYDRQDDIKIIAKLADNNIIRGESDTIKIIPPKVKRFEIVSPETIVAGQRFKVKIIAYNEFDRVMTNYNLYGNTVILRSSGLGVLTPNKIPPSQFVNGVATVELMYDKAEKFNIIATVAEEEIPFKEIKVREEMKDKKIDKKEAKHKKIAPIKGRQFLELKNISVVETKTICSLILHIPHIDKQGGYRPTTKKVGNLMSIILEVYPVKNKLESPVKIDSEFIREITLSEQQNKIILDIILKKPLKYRVLKKKDELIVELRRG
jgi:hypothetical protein